MRMGTRQLFNEKKSNAVTEQGVQVQLARHGARVAEERRQAYRHRKRRKKSRGTRHGTKVTAEEKGRRWKDAHKDVAFVNGCAPDLRGTKKPKEIESIRCFSVSLRTAIIQGKQEIKWRNKTTKCRSKRLVILWGGGLIGYAQCLVYVVTPRVAFLARTRVAPARIPHRPSTTPPPSCDLTVRGHAAAVTKVGQGWVSHARALVARRSRPRPRRP